MKNTTIADKKSKLGPNHDGHIRAKLYLERQSYESKKECATLQETVGTQLTFMMRFGRALMVGQRRALPKNTICALLTTGGA